MKILVFAYHDIGCIALKTLKDMGHEIGALFTHEDDAGENVWFGSVKKTAESLNIPVFTPEDPNRPEWVQKIKALAPDIIFSFYYRKMICEDILYVPPKGSLNLHGSLLPKFRGRAPVNWVLVKGEKETGITLHYMVKKPDAGDIVAQKKVLVAEDDDALTLYKKLVPLTRDLLWETVPLLEKGTAPRVPQDSSRASYFGGRKPEDGRIDWTKSAEETYNLIRAVTHPYPGAFTFWKGKKVFIWKARRQPQTSRAPAAGTVLAAEPLTVACGKDFLVLERLQTEDEKEMAAADWLQAGGVRAGDKLGGVQA